MLIVAGIYNVIVCFVYGWDKLAAKRGARRTPEATLLWLAALLGAPGALAGMYLFHHKTRKPRFAFGLPALLLLQAGAWFWGRTQGWW